MLLCGNSSLVVVSGERLFVLVSRLLTTVASLGTRAPEHRLNSYRLGCSTACVVSPALAGQFLTAEPPRKPCRPSSF